MNKSPSKIWLLLAVAAVCPLLTGCPEGDGVGSSTSNAKEAPIYLDPPADPNPKVDSEESWKKFFSKSKAVVEKPTLAEEKWKKDHSAGKLQVRLLKSDPEMEYMQFGKGSPVKGANPDRDYELGVVTLAAKEDKGSDGFQIRTYKLKFITPRQDGKWVFALGYYEISTNNEPLSEQLTGWNLFTQEDFEKSYLKLLFFDPPPTAEAEPSS